MSDNKYWYLLWKYLQCIYSSQIWDRHLYRDVWFTMLKLPTNSERQNSAFGHLANKNVLSANLTRQVRSLVSRSRFHGVRCYLWHFCRRQGCQKQSGTWKGYQRGCNTSTYCMQISFKCLAPLLSRAVRGQAEQPKCRLGPSLRRLPRDPRGLFGGLCRQGSDLLSNGASKESRNRSSE